jgi:serine/threonine protein kinase
MSGSDVDRNLLFGFLALQNNFIAREELLTAVNVWMTDKSRPLGNILRDRHALAEDEHELIAALARKVLARHDNDPKDSLASLSSVHAIGGELTKLGDADVTATLGGLSPSQPSTAPDPMATLPAGDLLLDKARFRILRPHAEGGLGQVFLAQDTELNREVALKEIKLLHSGNVDSRARFVVEAEITGNLEHPGIVPVYGLGQYPDGRPYYAMRFIRGDSLAEAVDRFYAKGDAHANNHSHENDHNRQAIDRQRYDSVEFRQLLSRFIAVCNAIEYAHSRGVIHRDLKPGNIMLGKYGETLVVDWGLAKAQGRAEVVRTQQQSFDEHTLQPRSGSGPAATQMGAAIGTPVYMSPEQAAGRLNQLGPATDVYSLGATLYYLLTGQPPFDKRENIGTVLRQVQAGVFNPPTLIRPQVPRALEAICLKAMAKTPADRYASAQLLADDVERYLADDPVAAHREPAMVRLRRWVRRHPRSVAAIATTLVAGLACASIIALVVAATNQQLTDVNQKLTAAHAAELAASRAERLAKADADQKRIDAEKARDENKRVLDYLVDSFRKHDPHAEGAKLTVVELFDQAAAELETAFPDQPLVQIHLLNAIGLSYFNLGLYTKSVALHERAFKVSEQTLGNDHRDTLTSLENLGNAYRFDGQFAAATPVLEQVLKLRKTQFGPQHPGTLTAMRHLATAYAYAGRNREAQTLYEQTLALQKATLGENHPDTLATMTSLFTAYVTAGRNAEAEKLHQQIATIRPEPEQPIAREAPDAVATSEQMVASFQTSFGPEHPLTLGFMNTLANDYRSAGRLSDAISLLERTLKLQRAKLGADHPDTLKSSNDLAVIYQLAGRMPAALPLFEETLDLRKTKLGPEHPATLTSMHNLAEAYAAENHLEEAARLFEQTLKLRTSQLGADAADTLATQRNLAMTYLASGQTPQALTAIHDFVTKSRQRAGAESLYFASLLFNLSLDLLAHRQAEQAEIYLRESLAIREKITPDDWSLPNTQSLLGDALTAQKKFDQAQPLLIQGYEGLKKHEADLPPPPQPRIAAAIQRLIRLYDAWAKPDESAKWQRVAN